MAATAPDRCVGLPAWHGVAIGRAWVLDRAEIPGLHRRLSDLEVCQEMQSLLQKVPGKFEAPGRGDIARPLRAKFLEAVERVLRREGGGLEFAIATVLTEYQGGIDIAPDRRMKGTLEELTDLAEAVLGALLDRRLRGGACESIYIALAPSLTLAEAMNLKPGLVGLAVGSGLDREIAAAGRLLKIPAVLGMANVREFARDGDVVRVDGETGTIEILARMVTRVN